MFQWRIQERCHSQGPEVQISCGDKKLLMKCIKTIRHDGTTLEHRFEGIIWTGRI